MNRGSSPTRRRFLGSALAAGASAALTGGLASTAAQTPAAPPAQDVARKLKLGIIGCGGRGMWISELFRKHGGYTIHAVADYFPEVADKAGESWALTRPAGSAACRDTSDCSPAAWRRSRSKTYRISIRSRHGPQWRRASTSTSPSRWPWMCPAR